MARSITDTILKLLRVERSGKADASLAGVRAREMMQRHGITVTLDEECQRPQPDVEGVQWRERLMTAIAQSRRCKLLRAPGRSCTVLLSGMETDVIEVRREYERVVTEFMIGAKTSWALYSKWPMPMSNYRRFTPATATWFYGYLDMAANTAADALAAKVEEAQRVETATAATPRRRNSRIFEEMFNAQGFTSLDPLGKAKAKMAESKAQVEAARAARTSTASQEQYSGGPATPLYEAANSNKEIARMKRLLGTLDAKVGSAETDLLIARAEEAGRAAGARVHWTPKRSLRLLTAHSTAARQGAQVEIKPGPVLVCICGHEAARHWAGERKCRICVNCRKFRPRAEVQP